MDRKRVVLVTGASSGIGEACARRLAEEGCLVFGTSRRENELRKLQTFSGGGELYLLPMDVTDTKSVIRGVSMVLAHTDNTIDIVVNNAGMGIFGPVEETDDAEAWRQIDTNLMGPFRVCRTVLPVMRQNGGGLIVFISSLAAEVGLPFQSLYSASKAGLNAFAEALQIEAGPLVNMVVVEPGDCKTSFTEKRIMVKGHKNTSPHNTRCRIVLQSQEKAEREGCDPSLVASLVWRVVQNPRPRFCYRVGPDALTVSLSRFVPRWLVQKVVASDYGL